MSKTVLINYTGRKGAGALIALANAEAFLHNGVDVIAIVSAYAENIEQWKKLPLKKLIILKTYKNKVSFLYKTCLFNLFGATKLYNQLKDLVIDYIYCPMNAFWTYLINKKFKNIPVIIVNHDPKAHLGDKEIGLLENSYYSSDIILVHSKIFIDYVKEKYSKPCYFIPLGRHNVYNLIKNKKTIINYDNSKHNFLFFGRITPYKGLDVLYEAYKKLELEYTDVNLIIAGNGDFEKYKEKFNSLKSCQIYNRWIADEETESLFICNNLICVMPYIEATQSGVALVAMDYGIPVIASKVGGLVEQIENEKTGLLVEPGASEELYTAMKRLAFDNALYNKISENENKKIKELDWNEIIKTVDKIFNDYKA